MTLVLFILLGIFLFPKPIFAAKRRVSILATSDIHGRFLPWDYTTDGEDLRGSLAQIGTLVEEIRGEGHPVILLDAGDLLQGNASELFLDEEIPPGVQLLNAMGYDAWTPGNHEFDFGLPFLEKAMGHFQGKVLAGNVTGPGSELMEDGLIVDCDGIEIAIIGMTTPMVAQFKEASKILGDLKFLDPVEEVGRVLKELPPVHAIVGLFHMGLENENRVPHTGVRDIAEAHEELDVIIAAHMHEAIEGTLAGGALIGEPGKFGQHLLRIDLDFLDTEEGPRLVRRTSSLIDVQGDTTVSPEPHLIEKMLPYHKRAREVAEEVLGTLEGDPLVLPNRLPGLPRVKTEPTGLSQWIGRVMQEASGADVVAFQIDNDDAGLEPGPLRKKDIYRNYQYRGGEVSVYQITGEDLKAYMEWSAGYFNRVAPGDVHISFSPKRRALKYATFDIFYGVSYTIDLSRRRGSRIRDLRFLDGRPIVEDTLLTLGVTSYRMRSLLAPGGPLEGRMLSRLYSTADENHLGPRGKIQRLLIDDIRRQGVLHTSRLRPWRILGPIGDHPGIHEAEELLRRHILELPSSSEGTNTRSLNVYEIPTKEEREAILLRAGIVATPPEDLHAGELYHFILDHLPEKDEDF